MSNGQCETNEGERCQLKFDNLYKVMGHHSVDNIMSILGEFIDNSISAAIASNLVYNVDIYIEELQKNKVIEFSINDRSGGIIEEDLKNVFSPGYSGSNKGPYNNFGYGLKQTLWTIQLDKSQVDVTPRNNWSIFTITDDDIKNNITRYVEGPLLDCVYVKSGPLNLFYRDGKDEMFSKFVVPGTRARFVLDQNGLIPLFGDLKMGKRGRPTFKDRIYRLHELIAWSYGLSIGVKGYINIHHKAYNTTEWVKEIVHPLGPVYKDGYKELDFTSLGYKFKYEFGKLMTPSRREKEAKQNEDLNVHIYPLSKYEQQPGTAGIDVVIGEKYGKRICRIPLKDMFGTDTSKLEYASYHGVIYCPLNMPITCLHNIKDRVDKWSPVISNLLNEIRGEKTDPSTVMKSTSEKKIHLKIKPQLERRVRDPRNLFYEFSVNNRKPNLNGRWPLRIDFMLKLPGGSYQLIEVSKKVDTGHIFKMIAYRDFVMRQWSDITWNRDEEPPDMEFTLVAPYPEDDYILSYLTDFGFTFEPLSDFNIDDVENIGND